MLQKLLAPNAVIQETAKTYPKRTFWGYTWRYLLVMALAAIPILFLTAAFFMLSVALGWELASAYNGIVMYASTAVGYLLAVYLYCHKLERRTLRSMGLTKKDAGKQYSVGLLIGIVFITVRLGIMAAFGEVKLQESVTISSLIVFFLVTLVCGLLAVLMDIGYYFVSVASGKTPAFAVLACTVVVSLFQLINLSNGILTWLTGIAFYLFIYLYFLYSGNLWGVAAINGVQSVLNSTLSVETEFAKGYQWCADLTSFSFWAVGIAVLLLLLYRRQKKTCKEA